MRLFISIFVVVISASNLFAFERSIVVSSYAKEKDAKKVLISTNKKYIKFSKLINYAKKHNYKVAIRKVGNYYAIVVEPFFNKASLDKSFRIIKKDFKSSFVINYLGIKKEPSKIKTIKPIQKSVDMKERNDKEMKEILNDKKCSWIFGCED